ncbi:MAG: hypothetical protein H6977_09475 [Gammaproteobacteria bacterium]|nr:hypothetical protein [Gammaproteobacteria bacterium]MCP5200234.1 hypothetical protein [Gammaproteobacteria bacterium]
MNDEIGFYDLKVDYVTLAEARRLGGLRLVLGAYTIPGPWRESCKNLFEVKGIPYTPVRCSNADAEEILFGANGGHSELIAWTAQSSAPVAIWEDERPRASWLDQINLAERLAPEPRLVPADFDQRVRMFGLINELAGENGFAWNRRVSLVDGALANTEPGSADHAFWTTLGAKYQFSADAAARAQQRMADVMGNFSALIEAQRARGSQYLIGESLTALDIYAACFYALVDPLPENLCPMATSYRPAYTNSDPVLAAAVSPLLGEHRDYVYRTHLRLPVVF